MRRPHETDRGRTRLRRLAPIFLVGAVAAGASLPARWRLPAIAGISLIIFCIALVRLVRQDTPAEKRRLASAEDRDPASTDQRHLSSTAERYPPAGRKIAEDRHRATDPQDDDGLSTSHGESATWPERTGMLWGKITRRFRRDPSRNSTGALPAEYPAHDGAARVGSMAALGAGNAAPGVGSTAVAGPTSVAVAGVGSAAAPGASPGPGAEPGLEAVTVGPVTELDRTTVPLGPRVVTGAINSSTYFGGRVVGRPFEVRGASLPGLSHLLEGRPGQDCLAAGWLPHRDSLLVAAADGLGSRADSGFVAAFALRRLLDFGQDPRYQQSTLEQLVEQVRRDTADKLSHDAHDGATTLIAAELRPVPGGAEIDIVAVGDSEAWHLNDTTWKALHHERGEGTRALPQTTAKVAARLLLPAGTVLMLATDGVAEALSSGNSALARELAARFVRPPRPVEFANLMEFRHEMFNDDRSAVAVWLLGER